MTDSVVQQFSRHLAGLDEAERARAIARVKMLAMQEAPDAAFEPPIRTLRDYLAAPIEVPPVVIEPYIVVRGGVNATIGRAGKGKTVMNLNRILRWGAGLPMFKGWSDPEGNAYLAPKEPIKTLIIENEGAAGLFHRQIGLMLHAEGFLTQTERDLTLENVHVWGEGGYSNLKFDDPAKMDGVRAGVEKWEPDLVFVEPFRSLWSGEENSATEMAVVVDNLIGLATDYDCGVIISHHERKSGVGEDREKMSAGRGSTVLEGAVTTMENFESIKGGELRELTFSKARHVDPPSPVRMEWVPNAWWYKWVPISDLEEAVIVALKGNGDEPMSVRDLCEELDMEPHQIRPVCNRLSDDKKIVKMPSISGSGGSTGHRFRMPSEDNDHGGLAL